ncbi:ComEC/Rec2 family competence protein [Pedobacter panaciterrae]
MGNVKMRVWDVKHGSAIFIRTPNDKIFVIDLGRGDYSENSDDRSPLETIKHHYGIDTIHYLTITHPHKDHIDDILNLDRLGFSVEILHRASWLNEQDVTVGNIKLSDKPKFDKYLAMNRTYTQPISVNNNISVPANNGGLVVKHFSTPGLPASNLNNHSIVTVLEYELTKIVIPGDNEWESLEKLMENTEFVSTIRNCDILIAPHHGRDSAYHTRFVSQCNPAVTIVSDGSICDTSANSKYSSMSRGWDVWKNGQSLSRKLLATNSDGEIYIDFGRDQGALKPYLRIEVKG